MAIANYMVEFTGMDQLWFVVSPQNPLKEKKTLLPEGSRLFMVNEAIQYYTKFKSSNIEFGLPQPSYTVNTLAHLKEKYPKHKFSLIMGQDNLATFDKWKNYEEILNHHKIFVYPRPNCEKSKFDKHPSVVFTEAPLMDISSTFIRDAIKKKKDIRFFLPEKVWDYVNSMSFYKK